MTGKAWEIKSNTKKMLELELFVYNETLLIGKVLYQDESLRGNGHETKLVVEIDNGFRIRSYSNPEIRSNELFVRGSIKEKDNMPIHYAFESHEDLVSYVCNIKKALAKINKTQKLPEVDVTGFFKKVL